MSIGARAFIAILLMIAFYVLALGIAGLLFWIPYAELTYQDKVDRLGLLGIVAGGTVLWSILPRIDRFIPPGPLLRQDEQRRLFELIEQVAAQTGQKMPSEAYLIPDVNAWVAQRGGIMGIGSRRVMGIGLPLLHTLSSDELRAVMAHEFGHYHAGDTRLGPWVYKTRAAIARTVQALESDTSIMMILVQAPFKFYGAFFLRVSHAVSRSQEYAADALAVQVAGARNLASGLKRIHAVGPLYEGFWRGEFAPLLNAGFAPSLREGLRRFFAADEVHRGLDRVLAASMEKTESDAFDTHPALRLRLEAIGQNADTALAQQGPKVAELLGDEKTLEMKLLAFFLGDQATAQLKPIAWEDVGATVYRDLLQRSAVAARPALTGVTPEALPEIATQFHMRQGHLSRAKPGETYFREKGDAATQHVAAALTMAAVQAGAEIVSRPCHPLLVRTQSETIDFFEEFERLRSSSDLDRWNRIIVLAGIRGVDLGASVPPES